MDTDKVESATEADLPRIGGHKVLNLAAREHETIAGPLLTFETLEQK